MKSQSEPKQSWLKRNGESIGFVLIGFTVLAIGLWLVEDDNPARGVLDIMGAAALILAPIASRLEGALILGPRGVQATLAKRHGRQVLQAAAQAPDDVLAATLPLLRGDFASRVLVLPSQYAGNRLIDPDLAFIRKERKVTAFAILLPNESNWRAGGEISEIPLPGGTQLLVCGKPEAVAQLARQLEET
jgi:hypothetical protein